MIFKRLIVVGILSGIVIGLFLSAKVGSAQSDTEPNPNTMLIRSFPSGLEVHVVPKGLAEGYMGDMYRVDDDYLVGTTPVETQVEPGEYYVYIDLPFEQAMNFREDGEVSKTFYLSEDGSNVIPGGKAYLVTKREGHQALVSALFWPQDQSLGDFVTALPTESLFPLPNDEFFSETFLAHGIPAEDQPILQNMLAHTGKLVWYSADETQHLFIYFTEPDQLIVEPHIPIPSDTTSDEPIGPIQTAQIYTSEDPIVAMAGDQAGNLYAITYDSGTVLKITPDGTVTTLYSGLEPCGLSLQAMAVLPSGEIVANSCVEDKDTLLRIDQSGNTTPLIASTDDHILSLASDTVERIYIGFWHTEGNLTVEMSPNHFTSANYISGRVITLDTDGTETMLYEGGLPLALNMSENGTLYAALWGQSGPFSAEAKSYSVCDPRVVFWIALSDQVQIADLTSGQAVPLTDQLQAGVSVVSAGDSLVAAGMLPDGDCGIYEIKLSQIPERLPFTETEIDHDLTAITALGDVLYFADVDGNVYRVGSGAPVAASTPVPAVSDEVPVESSASISETIPITIDNANQLTELAVVGSGEISSVTWNLDKTSFAAASSRGVWLFDSTGQNGKLLGGHTGIVLGVMYSPDGTTLASWSEDGTIRLWNALSGVEQQVLQGHTSTVYSATFSQDGTKLVSSSSDETVRLWDLATGEEQQSFTGCHDRIIGSVAMSPDTSLIASGGRDHKICLWDVASGSLKQTLEGHTDLVEAVTFSPDGKLLASSGYYDHTIRLWDVVTGQTVSTLESGSANRVAFSADGSLIAAEGQYDLSRVWDVATGAQLQEIWLSSPVQAFPPPGSSILATVVNEQTDHSLVIQSMTDGEMVGTLALPSEDIGSVNSLDYNADGTLLASGGGITANLWDGRTGERVSDLENPLYTGSHLVAFKSDGTTLASAGYNFGGILMWEIPSSVLLTTHEGHELGNPAWSAEAFSPDLSLLAVSREDGSIEVWDLATDTQRYTLLGHIDELRSLAFSPDGTLLASAGKDQIVRIWNVADGTLLYSLEEHTETITSLAFSPHGTVLATAGSDGIRLWNVITGMPLQALRVDMDLTVSLAFSPDGSMLASGHDDGKILLWNLATYESVGTLVGHMGSVRSLVFRPDGSMLASGGRDNTIRLWGVLAE